MSVCFYILMSGADTGFGGGVPRNLVNDNMWREAPLETPKASQGEGTEGGGPSGLLSVGGGGVWGASPKKIVKIKCSRSDSEGTWADLRHIRNIFKGHFCKDHTPPLGAPPPLGTPRPGGGGAMAPLAPPWIRPWMSSILNTGIILFTRCIFRKIEHSLQYLPRFYCNIYGHI